MRAVPRNVARVFDRALEERPDAEALVTRSARLSYARLDELAHRAAHALAELGVARGDRVGACLPNESDVVVAFHGAMRLGAVWVGINQALAPPERRHLLADCGARVLLTGEGGAPGAADGADGADGPDVRVVTVDELRAAIAAAPATAWAGVDPDPFAPAGIAYTSGTTGHPKGAVHSQHNLLLPGAVLVESRRYGPGLRKGDCFPFTILNMAVLTTLLVSQARGTSIVMDRIDAEGVAEWIRNERITTWNGPPALLHSLAGHAAVHPEDLASLDEVWTGGADCPEAIRQAFSERFGLPVLATYGLTEAPTVVAIDDRPGRRSGPSDHRPGGSGRVLPHLRVRIAGVDGTTVAPGERGQICVSAADDRYRPFLGYWERPEATAATLLDGELRTGDVGFIDEAGHLHVVDRLSLVIIRGGANVYPAEVERVLASIDGVEAAAVLGVPDERLGERVAAVVQLGAGVDVDEAHLRDRLLGQLARYKVPEVIRFVDRLPRNAMGKVVRTELPALLGLPTDDP